MHARTHARTHPYMHACTHVSRPTACASTCEHVYESYMHTGTAQMCAQVIREKEAQLKAEHEQAAIQLRTEHDEQLKQLHALTENAGGAEQAALQQLEQARKECAVLQERLQGAEQVGHCRGCLPAAA